MVAGTRRAGDPPREGELVDELGLADRVRRGGAEAVEKLIPAGALLEADPVENGRAVSGDRLAHPVVTLGVPRQRLLDGGPGLTDIRSLLDAERAIAGGHRLLFESGLGFGFPEPRPRPFGQNVELFGRHRPEQFPINHGDEGAAPVGHGFGAFEPLAGGRALELRARSPEVGPPHHHRHGVEAHGDRRGHQQRMNSRGHTDDDGEEDEDRVLGVAKPVPEADRSHDAAQAEGEGGAVLHEQDHPGDHEGQEDEGLHDGLLEALLAPRLHVHPGHGQHQGARAGERDHRGHHHAPRGEGHSGGVRGARGPGDEAGHGQRGIHILEGLRRD